jgi:hypothetical protein
MDLLPFLSTYQERTVKISPCSHETEVENTESSQDYESNKSKAVWIGGL